MTGSISYGNDRHISGGGTSTDFDFHAGKVAIRLSPENAVGNDISRCVNIRDTGTGALYPIATATPPQTFNLPMAESFTAYPGYACIYYKTQFGEIGIQFIAQYVGTGTIGIKLLAILPEGFRPAYHCEFPMLVNFDGQQSIALITVDADGGIYLHSYSSSTDNGAAVSGYARFIAAN